MKTNADCHYREQEFEADDMVFMKLQPFRQRSIPSIGKMKLAPRFYGPYRVMERIGEVAYCLDLPSHSRIHLVFHMSQLKKKLIAANCVVEELPCHWGRHDMLGT